MPTKILVGQALTYKINNFYFTRKSILCYKLLFPTRTAGGFLLRIGLFLSRETLLMLSWLKPVKHAQQDKNHPDGHTQIHLLYR